MRSQTLVERHMRPWPDAANSTVDSVLAAPMYLSQVPIQPVPVARQCCARIARNCLQFRAEDERAVEARIVERFYPQSTSHEAQCSLADIPERDREHGVAQLERS